MQIMQLQIVATLFLIDVNLVDQLFERSEYSRTDSVDVVIQSIKDPDLRQFQPTPKPFRPSCKPKTSHSDTYASTTLFNRFIYLNTTALSAAFAQNQMNDNNNFNEIMPHNCRQEEETACAHVRDDQEHEERGERDEGVTRGPDHNDSPLPILEALQDLLTNGANIAMKEGCGAK